MRNKNCNEGTRSTNYGDLEHEELDDCIIKLISDYRDDLDNSRIVKLNKEGEIFSKSSEKQEPFSNYFIKITEELHLIDGVNPIEIMLCVLVVCKEKCIVRETCISLAEFQNDKWVWNLDIAFRTFPGVSNAYSYVKNAAVEANRAEKVQAITAVGWFVYEGKPVFITNGEVISYDKNEYSWQD